MDYATAILALSKTVHIANRVSFNEKLSIIAKGGQNSLQCVFDFDATISKAFHNGQRVSVTFGTKRTENYFSFLTPTGQIGTNCLKFKYQGSPRREFTMLRIYGLCTVHNTFCN